METNDVQNIWKNIDSEINLKTTDELHQLLTAKTRKTINKFLMIISIDVLVCVGLIAFLLTTMLNRQGDTIYQVNNSILCIFTLFALIVSVLSWNKLQNNKYNLSLKDWLEQRIKLLIKWLLGRYSKLYILLIPVLLVMINLSIHVYYERKSFTEVMQYEESIYGLTVGFIIGLFVSFIAVQKIRRYQLKNLEFLEEIHSHL
ncbi:MAG TPA: hypothetical protein DCR40_09335 [Prolixibacteraceae bacterium]|nr:hypothetical protein [Prolixibacteraceae bacterium]